MAGKGFRSGKAILDFGKSVTQSYHGSRWSLNTMRDLSFCRYLPRDATIIGSIEAKNGLSVKENLHPYFVRFIQKSPNSPQNLTFCNLTVFLQ